MSYVDGSDAGSDSSSSSSSTVAPGSASNKRPKPPQDAINEFWAKFAAKTPSKATTVIPQSTYADIVAKKNVDITVTTTTASFDEAAAICRAKVEKIVKECRRINKKYRDPHFDIEMDLKCNYRDCLESLTNGSDPTSRPGGSLQPQSVKRVGDIFDDPKFYIDGPTTSDVRQGRTGDCWLMAALCTLSNKPGLIERLCVAHDQAVGVYGFVFHQDGQWISSIVDDFLYLIKPDYDESYFDRILFEDVQQNNPEEAYRKIYQSNSAALYFAQCADPQETWLPLLEKAYAKAHGDYASIEGGFGGEGLEDLTGGVTSELWSSDILDRDQFWKELLQVNEEFLFGCSTGVWGNGWGERKGIVESHAYSVQKAVEIDGKRLLKLKNPWGKGEWNGAWSDGSKEWTSYWLEKLEHRFGDDGDFWIEYSDLLRKYQSFERTRLFGPDWRVTQDWTTLNVPWTLDYHDTHFAFTIKKAGPVVILLSQLDERYFRGLEGRYRFELTLRLHQAGQEDYIVRSQTPYRMNRSTNVELNLEAGNYEVRVKVNALKIDQLLPIEDVVRNYAKDRRDKLIKIGLAYDLAHSKGRIIETPAEKAAKEAYEKKEKLKKRTEVKTKILKLRDEGHYLRVKQWHRDQKKHERKKEKKQAKLAAKKARKEARKAAKLAEKEAKAKEEESEAEDETEVKEETKVKTEPEVKEEPEDDVKPIKAPAAKSKGKKAEKEEKPAPHKKGGKSKKKTEPEPEVEEEEEEEEEEEDEEEEDDDDEDDEDYEEDDDEEEDDSSDEEEEEEDDISTVAALSELSDRELEIQIDALTPAEETPAVPDADEEPDEFEKDPWNAVVVVGLRIYYKLDTDDKTSEAIQLKIIRPNPYEEKKDGSTEEGKDCKTSGLDVDDSAKDVTLEGEAPDRQKQITGEKGTEEKATEEKEAAKSE